MTATKKVWTRDEIVQKINTDQEWVERAILRIYKGQTLSEKAARMTTDHNNIGFNNAHARPGQYIAEYLLSSDPKTGKRRHLTGEWVEKARKIALRHVRQLLAYANREHEAPK